MLLLNANSTRDKKNGSSSFGIGKNSYISGSSLNLIKNILEESSVDGNFKNIVPVMINPTMISVLLGELTLPFHEFLNYV